MSKNFSYLPKIVLDTQRELKNIFETLKYYSTNENGDIFFRHIERISLRGHVVPSYYEDEFAKLTEEAIRIVVSHMSEQLLLIYGKRIIKDGFYKTIQYILDCNILTTGEYVEILSKFTKMVSLKYRDIHYEDSDEKMIILNKTLKIHDEINKTKNKILYRLESNKRKSDLYNSDQYNIRLKTIKMILKNNK